MGFGGLGLEFMVWGLGCKISGCRVWGSRL